jgi:tetratricopeptide (TPR) repeat protein
MARFYIRSGDYVQAELLLQRSLSIKEKILGTESPTLALTLDTLAYINAEKGEYVQAEQLYQRSFSLVEKAVGVDHFQYAFHLKNLGDLYLRMRDYKRAEAILHQALAIKERTAGKDHPEITSTLISLAVLNEVQGERVQTIGFMRRATDISEHNLTLIIATGSEEQKRLYLAKLTDETDAALSLHIRSAPNDVDAARLALTTALRRKGAGA